MSNQKNDDILDPIESELSSWKAVNVPKDTNDRLTAAMRSGWEAASSSTDAAERRESSDVRTNGMSGDASPAAIVTSRRSWLIAGGTLLATAASVSMFVFFVLGERSVYAQVIAAIANSRTVHAVRYLYDDDGEQTQNSSEIWYDAEKGVREESTLEGVKSFRIDDGTHEWMYRGVPNTVVKNISRDPIGRIKDILEPLRFLEKLNGKIDDSLEPPTGLENCIAYVADRMPDAADFRAICWVDEQKRLRRFEGFRQQSGQWHISQRIDLKYDLDIPADKLLADFGDARLIDRTVAMKPFAADKVVASGEKLGVVIGVHDVRRLNDDAVFVMSTSRPSEEVERRFGKIDPHREGFGARYGSYEWGTNGRRLPNHNWQEGVYPIELARWSHGGVGFHWVLLLRASRMLRDDSTMPIGLHIYSRGKWQDALKKEGKPWYISQATDVMTIPVPEPTNSLDDVLDDVYQQILTMGDGTRSSPALDMGSKKWSKERIAKEIADGMSEHEANLMSTGLQGFTFDTSLEQWKASVKKRIAKAFDH